MRPFLFFIFGVMVGVLGVSILPNIWPEFMGNVAGLNEADDARHGTKHGAAQIVGTAPDQTVVGNARISSNREADTRPLDKLKFADDREIRTDKARNPSVAVSSSSSSEHRQNYTKPIGVESGVPEKSLEAVTEGLIQVLDESTITSLFENHTRAELRSRCLDFYSQQMASSKASTEIAGECDSLIKIYSG